MCYICWTECPGLLPCCRSAVSLWISPVGEVPLYISIHSLREAAATQFSDPVHSSGMNQTWALTAINIHKGKDHYSPFTEEKLRHKVITPSQWHTWTENPVSPTPATRCFKIGQSHFNMNNLVNIFLTFVSVFSETNDLFFYLPFLSPHNTGSKVPGNLVKSASRFIPLMIFTVSYKIQGQPVNHQMRALWTLLHFFRSTQIITWLTRRIKMEKNNEEE